MRRRWIVVLSIILALELLAVGGLLYRSGVRKEQAQKVSSSQKGPELSKEAAEAQESLAREGQEAAEPEEDPAQDEEKNGYVIAIDPGHQGSHVDMSALEENAPGSGEMKAKATGGTKGSYTDLPEYQLNLDVALKVRDMLEEKGYEVVMAREDNDKAISNKERAELANESGADVCVRIHANGSEEPSSQGALCLVMSKDNPYVGQLYEESSRLAEAVLGAYCEATGFRDQGVITSDTMTGINWSKIPVVILEMGFMTNEHDDTKMADEDFQQTMAEGIVQGIEAYFGE